MSHAVPLQRGYRDLERDNDQPIRAKIVVDSFIAETEMFPFFCVKSREEKVCNKKRTNKSKPKIDLKANKVTKSYKI